MERKRKSTTHLLNISCSIKDKLKEEVPRNFYLTTCFLEGVTLISGLPSRQEYSASEWDLQTVKQRLLQSIDKYFPTDNNIMIVEKIVEKVVEKFVPREVIVKEKVEVVKYIDKLSEEEFLSKGHELIYGLGMP